MLRAGGFHLYLHLAVARIHVVELLLPGSARIVLHFIIKVLPHAHEGAYTRKAQAQIIEPSISVGRFRHPHGSLLEGGDADHQHRAEIEVVPERAALVINHGGFSKLAAYQLEMVRIDHRGGGVPGHLLHPLQAVVHPAEFSLFGDEQGVIAPGALSYVPDSLGGRTRRNVECLHI